MRVVTASHQGYPQVLFLGVCRRREYQNMERLLQRSLDGRKLSESLTSVKERACQMNLNQPDRVSTYAQKMIAQDGMVTLEGSRAVGCREDQCRRECCAHDRR